MSTLRKNASVLVLGLLFPFAGAIAGGKHLEIMAPLCRQHDFKGKPHHVTERTSESSAGNKLSLLSVKQSEYDKDGNGIRIETFDSSNRRTDSEVYGYDATGTWISLIEESKGSPPTTSQIFLDPQTKRIAKVDKKSKQTEFTTYSGRGFELGTFTKDAAGKIVEQTTMTRNAEDKEEHVLFEEPPGTKTSEFSTSWNAQGFELTTTLIMHDKGGDSIVMSFEYADIDPAGNWLTQIKKEVLHRSNGTTTTLPTETTKRTITYHP